MHTHPDLHRYLRDVCAQPEDAELFYHLPDPDVLEALTPALRAKPGLANALTLPVRPGLPVPRRVLESVYRVTLREAEAAKSGLFRHDLTAGDVLAGIMRLCAKAPRLAEAVGQNQRQALRNTWLGQRLLQVTI